MTDRPALVHPSAYGTHPLVRAVLAVEAAVPDRVPLAIADDDEMLSFSLASRDGDFDLAIAEYAQSGARIVTSLRQIVRWRFGGFERIGRYLDFASGWGRVTRFLLAELPPERLWIAEIVPEAVAFQGSELGVHALQSTAAPEAFLVPPANGRARNDETATASTGSPPTPPQPPSPTLEVGEGGVWRDHSLAVPPSNHPEHPGSFDCIVVTSLFTHLPEDTFRRWLARLCQLLAPGGMLVLSAHDASLLPPGEVPARGFHFLPLSESRTLDTADYGSTWVSERYVRGALGEIAAELAAPLSCHRLERAYCNFHDLYLVVREAEVDFSGLAYERDPEGYLDYAALLPDGTLRLTGWCTYPPPSAGVLEGAIDRVELWIDDVLSASQSTLGERPDVAHDLGRPEVLHCGWELAAKLPATASSTITSILVRAVTRRGHSSVLYVGSTAMALRASARTDFAALARRYHENLIALADQDRTIAALEARVPPLLAALDDARTVATAHGATIDRLERRLATIEASRFWALRRAWWLVKGALFGARDPLA